LRFLLLILFFLFSCEKNSSSPLCCIDSCDELGNIEDCDGICNGTSIWCFDNDGILDNFNDYQYNGSLTSIVVSNDVSIGQPGDILGAFVSGELRGVAIATQIPSALGEGYAFLLLAYSNQPSEESIDFKFYDSDLNLIYDIMQSVDFTSDMTEGNIITPILLEIID
tara:strand:+ start:1085 stop:1585 length:501 start_codon:yes stop_codon:yes gene_type:complete